MKHEIRDSIWDAERRRSVLEMAGYLATCGATTTYHALGEKGLMSLDIRPLVPGSCIAGPATTVLCPDGQNAAFHCAIKYAHEGDVIVVATDDRATKALMGDMMAASMAAHEIRGVVMTAYARDVSKLRKMGFGVWGLGCYPAAPKKKEPGSVNVQIICGGQEVNPGDIIVADDDGIVVVPLASLDQVVAAAKKRVADETEKTRRLQAGEYAADDAMDGTLRSMLNLGVQRGEIHI